MNKVLVRANVIAVSVYLSIGIVGYAIFADRAEAQLQDTKKSRDILEADFG